MLPPESTPRSHRTRPVLLTGVALLLFAAGGIAIFGARPFLAQVTPVGTETPAADATPPPPPPPPPPPITSPQWGGTLSRNMVSDETGLPSTFDTGESDDNGGWTRPPLNIKWTAALGNQTFGTPTVAAGRVLVGTNN